MHSFRHVLLGRHAATIRLQGCAVFAFTLIELMVVVAIIALLTAVLLPSLAAARRQSKHLLCQTNLHSIAQAWHSYLSESDGWFPKSEKTSDNEQVNYGGKQGTGGKYYGSEPDSPVPKPLNRSLNMPLVVRTGADVFRCPFDTGGGGIKPTCFDNRGTSYLMNHLLVGPKSLQPRSSDPCKTVMEEMENSKNPPRRSRIENLKSSDLDNGSKLLLVGDYGWYNAWEYTVPYDRHMDWHRKAMHHNLAFADGHVAFVRIRKGLHTTSQYTVMPFVDLQSKAGECQAEVLPPAEDSADQ